ncbi:hypothetical protein GSH19_03925 [Lactobacillus sp. S2-2]|uniref:hypothetical protein n=1 Tax=Lactobacillus sp. S2-2 TaxID=2692917 RepID=UPI001F2FDB49|nr:hypothetical protein [Lactobacillus sp. S2-2]MCF6515302.1 hypothetical protein [Lactobacillus sp. S2-2]
MKKKTLLILGGFIFVFSISMNLYIKADYKPVKESYSTIEGLKLNDDQKLYYQLTKPMKQKIRVSDNHGEANRVQYITLPKGTIIDGDGGISDDTRLRSGADLSYHLMKKVYKKNTYGPASVASFMYKPKKMKIVKRPNYLLTDSNNYLFLGGLKAFSSNKYSSDLLKITSDGYLESYPYNRINFKEGKKEVTLNYLQKPESMGKIRFVKSKESVKYFYLKHPMKNIDLKKVKVNHKTYYRISLNNLKTPYSKFVTDIPLRIYGDIYKISNETYYTELTAGG